jgi:hypothetical protein
LLAHYAIGIAGIVVLALAWVGVQIAWRKAFPGVCADPDVLAGRMGCRGCSGTDECEARPPDPAGANEEECHERSGHAPG